MISMTEQILQEKKFNEFRDKVLKSKKLVKFHSGISDLKANVATAINAAIRDYPAVGWVRGDTQMQSSAVKNEVQVISVKTKIYADETDAGVFTFDYSNNNGRFSIERENICLQHNGVKQAIQVFMHIMTAQILIQ